MNKDYYSVICADFASEAKSEKYQNIDTLREWVRALTEWNQFLLKQFLHAQTPIRDRIHDLMKANAKLVKTVSAVIEMPEEDRARIR